MFTYPARMAFIPTVSAAAAAAAAATAAAAISICQHFNILDTLFPIMLILRHNNKSANEHF